MKKLFLIVFISVLAFVATAQHQKNWMSVSIGTAIPFNDFSDKVLTDTILHGGFAKTGFGFNVAYTRQLVRTFGITAMFMGNSNSSDINAIEKEMKRYIKESGVTGDFPHSGTVGKWRTGMFLVGPNINCGERFVLVEIRGLLGVGMGFSPEYDCSIEPAQGDLAGKNITFMQKSDNAVAFAWNVGAGAKYSFDRFFVRLNVDYTATNLEYKNINIEFYDSKEKRDYINRNSKMNIQTDIMQITGGIGYIF
jgi:opacity protein-like surface antigen